MKAGKIDAVKRERALSQNGKAQSTAVFGKII